MVGRLVEQQQVGARHQRASEVEPHAPAAGKIGYRPPEIGIGKAEPMQQFRRARFRRVAADVLQTAVQQGDAFAFVGRFGLDQLALDGAQFGVAVEREIECRIRQRRRFLADMGDGPRGRHFQIARLGVQFAAHQREE